MLKRSGAAGFELLVYRLVADHALTGTSNSNPGYSKRNISVDVRLRVVAHLAAPIDPDVGASSRNTCDIVQGQRVTGNVELTELPRVGRVVQVQL